MRRAFAVVALVAACGPSVPPRTSVTSSASQVSAAESVAPISKGPIELEQAPVDEEPGPPTQPERRGGRLLVRSPPDRPTPDAYSPFRRHVEGGFTANDDRSWVGFEVPELVPLTDSGAELTLLDTAPTGLVAYYRPPVDSESCHHSGDAVCAGIVVHYSLAGKVLWRYQLAEHLPRSENLDVRDLRYDQPFLYFNQACPKPARRDEECGRIVAIDTQTSNVVWRSKPRVSSSRLLVLEQVIVASAGSDPQTGSIVLVNRHTGEIADRTDTGFVATHLESEPGGVILARDDSGASLRLRVLDGSRLAPAPQTALP